MHGLNCEQRNAQGIQIQHRLVDPLFAYDATGSKRNQAGYQSDPKIVLIIYPKHWNFENQIANCPTADGSDYPQYTCGERQLCFPCPSQASLL
jgi:hypothetical protein